MKQNKNNIGKDNYRTSLEKGQLLHGTYQILRELSRGGFGTVYLAAHLHLGSLCAIKEICPDPQVNVGQELDKTFITTQISGEPNINQLIYEAKCLQLINNPHVVRYYDMFEEDGAYYIVMEYIEGDNLNEKLNKQDNGRLSEEEVDQILQQLLIALEDIHAHGLLHLDIKPTNIVQTPARTIKLIDFGSCLQMPSQSTITRPLSLIATYTNGFSPIEQIESQEDKLGPWTDFYALGATLYNLLTGKLPPKTSDLIETGVNSGAFRDLYNFSPKMRGLILWLMQPDRNNRPKNVMEILDFVSERNVLRNNNAQDSIDFWRVPLPADFILVSRSCKYRIIGTLAADHDSITYIAEAVADEKNQKNEGMYYLIGEKFEYRYSRRSGDGTIFDTDPLGTKTIPISFFKTAEKRTRIKEGTGTVTQKGKTQAERFYANGTSYYAVHIELKL